MTLSHLTKSAIGFFIYNIQILLSHGYTICFAPGLRSEENADQENRLREVFVFKPSRGFPPFMFCSLLMPPDRRHGHTDLESGDSRVKVLSRPLSHLQPWVPPLEGESSET